MIYSPAGTETWAEFRKDEAPHHTPRQALLLQIRVQIRQNKIQQQLLLCCSRVLYHFCRLGATTNVKKALKFDLILCVPSVPPPAVSVGCVTAIAAQISSSTRVQINPNNTWDSTQQRKVGGLPRAPSKSYVQQFCSSGIDGCVYSWCVCEREREKRERGMQTSVAGCESPVPVSSSTLFFKDEVSLFSIGFSSR